MLSPGNDGNVTQVPKRDVVVGDLAERRFAGLPGTDNVQPQRPREQRADQQAVRHHHQVAVPQG